MKSCFCTICTIDHLSYVITLHESIRQFDKTMELHALVVDSKNTRETKLPENLFLHHPQELSETPFATDILSKYANLGNELRWALKPVMVSFMLRNVCDRTILLDTDIYFFEPYQFLFDELKKNRALLTPHWRCKNPHENEFVFTNNFTDGVFNAGFFGANKDALEMVDWWAMVCHYKCEKDFERGFFNDQKYLDFLPSRFPGVGIVWHQGCNVALWNKHDCVRVQSDKGVLINGQYPVVFVHFTLYMIDDIKNEVYGGDPLMRPYLEKYEASLSGSKNTLALHV